LVSHIGSDWDMGNEIDPNDDGSGKLRRLVTARHGDTSQGEPVGRPPVSVCAGRQFLSVYGR
jgi:hypothetical protein